MLFLRCDRVVVIHWLSSLTLLRICSTSSNSSSWIDLFTRYLTHSTRALTIALHSLWLDCTRPHDNLQKRQKLRPYHTCMPLLRCLQFNILHYCSCRCTISSRQGSLNPQPSKEACFCLEFELMYTGEPVLTAGMQVVNPGAWHLKSSAPTLSNSTMSGCSPWPYQMLISIVRRGVIFSHHDLYKRNRIPCTVLNVIVLLPTNPVT